MQIMYASKKYMIPSLTERCSEFLKTNLTAQNVCDIFDPALRDYLQLSVSIQNQFGDSVNKRGLIAQGQQRNERQTLSLSNALYHKGEIFVTANNISHGVVIGLFAKYGEIKT